MRKRFLSALAVAGALLFLATGARAQVQTNVTATVMDSNGIPYAGGTYSIQLIPTGTNPTVNGNSIGGAFNGSLDANGRFNVSLWPNASIVPAATTWQFTICSNPGGIPSPLGTGTQCTPPTVVTISGASQSLSSTLSAVAPKLTNFLSPGGVTSITATPPITVTPDPIIGVGDVECPTCNTGTGSITACTVTGGILYQDGTNNEATCTDDLTRPAAGEIESVVPDQTNPNLLLENTTATLANSLELSVNNDGSSNINAVTPAGTVIWNADLAGNLNITPVVTVNINGDAAGDNALNVAGNGPGPTLIATSMDGFSETSLRAAEFEGYLSGPGALNNIVEGMGSFGVLADSTTATEEVRGAEFAATVQPPSTAVSFVRGAYIASLVAASTATIGTIEGIFVAPDLALGSTATNLFGIEIANQSAIGYSAANSAGLKIDDWGASALAIKTGTGKLSFGDTVSVYNAIATAGNGIASTYGADDHTAEITGNYGPTTLLASTFATGFYLVTIYTEVSTSVATSTIITSISYADDTGAQTQSGVLFSGATAGTVQSLTFPVRFVTGTALTYSTSTANSPKYKIFARVEAL